jgi:hypothetical protein
MIIVQVTRVASITGRPFLIHIPGVIARLGSPASLAILKIKLKIVVGYFISYKREICAMGVPG